MTDEVRTNKWTFHMRPIVGIRRHGEGWGEISIMDVPKELLPVKVVRIGKTEFRPVGDSDER